MQDAMRRELEIVVARALAEDVGAGDLTGESTVPQGTPARAAITQKEPGVIFGLEAAEHVFRTLDGRAAFQRPAPEGVWRDGGPVLDVQGDAQALLAAERTALNLLARLSGVATRTALFVRAVEGTGVKILDTRKTTPGLRLLEKAAVRAGGGTNHRTGLWDEILIKENHAYMAGGVRAAIERARADHPGVPLEVECRTREDVDEALSAGATRLLLDNMTPDELRAIARHVDGRAQLEASGGVDLQNVGEIARTGVQLISVGALTHSAPALDLSLLLEPLH